MIKKYYILLILVTVSYMNAGCQSSDAYKLLESAFTNNSVDLKVQFFENWYKLSKLKEQDFKEDSISNAIQIFFNNIFVPNIDTTKYYVYKFGYYDTLQSKFIERKVHWDGCFIKAEYFILRSFVRCFTYKDSIFNILYKNKSSSAYNKDFISTSDVACNYPDIEFKNKKKLYLTEDYYEILNMFIRAPYDRKNRKSKLLVDDRRMFLSPEIEISKMHDGHFYHFETFPYITMIFFNENYNKAIVQLRSSFNRGGYAVYIKIMNEWRLEEYKRNSWIQ